jgi:phosphate transport system permease protein
MNLRKRWQRRHFDEALAMIFMYLSFALVLGSLAMILWTIVSTGLPALTWEMVTQTPKGGYYLGKEGGILNAIIGSLYLAVGATILALIVSLPLALYIETYMGDSSWGRWVRLSLDVLWGIPSIVYGAFGFTIMLALGMRASLLGGIIVLAILEIPIMTRAMDEVIRRMPTELEQAALAMGSTKLEVATRVVVRQMLPGIITAILLAFGRAIGDAASVLFTAGYTDRIPTSLMDPAASLPLAVYFQLGTPFPAVQQRAYASALILTIIVLIISLGSRLLAGRISKYIVK